MAKTAIPTNSDELMELLTDDDKRVEVFAKDKYGKTALDYAEKAGLLQYS